MLASLYALFIDPVLRDVRSSIPAYAGMTAGDRVLDVCCGTGAQVEVYGRFGLRSVGLDINPDMINRAGHRKNGRSGDTTFVLSDATTLPFSDDSFDFVSVSFALHDKPPSVRGRTIQEMKRVVRPGGVLIFIDYQVPLPGNLWGMLGRTAEFLAGGSHYQGFRDYIRSGGLAGILAEHGITVTGSMLRTGGLIQIVLGGKSGGNPSLPHSSSSGVI